MKIKENKLSASLEDYLEAIYRVVCEKQAARAKDIASRLKVNNSSVTGALRTLSEKGLVNYAPYDLITLTQSGNEIAKDIIRRHHALKNFFIKILCINEDTAEEAACKMEHDVPKEILDKLILFVDFLQICPRAGEELIKGFTRHCEESILTGDCKNCIDICLSTLKDKKDIYENTPQKQVLLKDMEVNDLGKISEISKNSSAFQQFLEIGAGRGSILQVLEKDKQSVLIKTRGYNLHIRGDEAENIKILPY
ncbi:MAG: metal-dependent transcriptional regulator [Desulfobacteraceae bacterium]|nr:metal-dependent transcriptional regulator [Desulfobacteraceae bacterium]MCB9494781.1 metal-dependent transcriptional regulator [Desulfobacteraceae bacterium]